MNGPEECNEAEKHVDGGRSIERELLQSGKRR